MIKMQGQSPVSLACSRSRSRSKGSRSSCHSPSTSYTSKGGGVAKVDGLQYCDKFGKIGTYSGEVNAFNIPHGKGVFHGCGQTVEGWWVNGISLSTLKSFEVGQTLKSFEFVPDQQQKDCPTHSSLSVDRGVDPPSASDLTDADSTSSNSTYSTLPSSTVSFNSHPEQLSQQQREHSYPSRALEKKMSHHQVEMVPCIERRLVRRYNASPDPPCNDMRGGIAKYKKSYTSTPETVHTDDELGRQLQRLPSLTFDDNKRMSRSRSKSPSAAKSASATATQHECPPLTRHDQTSQNNDHQHDNNNDDNDEKKKKKKKKEKKSAKLFKKMKSSLPSRMKLKKPSSSSSKGGLHEQHKKKFKVGDMAEYKISSRVDTDDLNYFTDGAQQNCKMCVVRILEIKEDASNKLLYKILLSNGRVRVTGIKHLLPVTTTKHQKRKESYRSLCLQTKLYEEQCALWIR